MSEQNEMRENFSIIIRQNTPNFKNVTLKYMSKALRDELQ